ncbi:MAG: PhzF family phenazine biosynthesis protein [Clostridiales bacterium]|nr:PhzF family phenazine biosynthesis protein [Clostridiales bacterium]
MKYYIVDAFADQLFKGNQAGVCLLEEWLDDGIMQKIAKENNLAETAFLVKRDTSHDQSGALNDQSGAHNDQRGAHYDLRWFSPEVEIDLCGHATLASAFVVSSFVDKDAEVMRFETMSGTLTVQKTGDLFEMDFPARKPQRIEKTNPMEEAVGQPVLEAHLSRDLILIVDSEEQVKNLSPDLGLIKNMQDYFAVVVTARGDEVDFVSRFFAPGIGVPEDPVTGSAHSSLIPLWAGRLGKEKMVAKQLSERGGTLFCEDCDDRVKIAGRAVLYLQGEIII